MADREFKIKIVTDADATGAKDTAAGLEKVTDAAKQGTSHLEKHGKELEKLGIHHRELHRLIGLVSKASPEMGIALESGLLGPMGAILALGEAVHWLNETVEKGIERFKESAVDAAKAFTDVQSVVNETADAVLKARKGYEDWQEAANQSAVSIMSSLNEQTKAMEAQETLALRLIGLQAEMDKKAGGDKAIIDERARLQKERVEATAEKARFDMADKAAAQADQDLAAARERTEAAAKGAEPREGDAMAKKTKEELNKALEDATKKRIEADTASATFAHRSGWEIIKDRATHVSGWDKGEQKRLDDEAVKAAQEEATARGHAGHASDVVAQREVAADAHKKEFEDAKKAQEEAARQFEESVKKRGEAYTGMETGRSGRQQEAAARLTPDAFGAAVDASMKLAKDRTEADKNAISLLTEVLGGHLDVLRQVLTIAQGHRGELNWIKREIAVLHAQAGAGGPYSP